MWSGGSWCGVLDGRAGSSAFDQNDTVERRAPLRAKRDFPKKIILPAPTGGVRASHLARNNRDVMLVVANDPQRQGVGGQRFEETRQIVERVAAAHLPRG